jgi:4-amino-4-deoxy-L-arabinose transferase-like glycosyltransferase
MNQNRRIYWALGVLLVLSAAARAFIAGYLELGNDEVYYWTYAKFPDLSHFDHPPMVGWVIQLFTLNLRFESEFFIRLASVVLGTASTFLMFLIGKQVKDSLTGLYAAILYTTSFYGFILCSTFILPDTPQVLFWLLTIYFLIRSLPDREMTRRSRNFFFFAGVSAGLALLSKYHSIFLMTGAFFYILFYNRKWFAAKETYGAFLAFVLLFFPVIFWNWSNDFITFKFHGSRVGITESGIQTTYFLTEVVGQFFYNNPVNVVIILFAFVALSRRKDILERSYQRLILWICVPMVLLFLGFSLFRSTLPHWTGPAYLGFLIIAAAYLSGVKGRTKKRYLFPWPLVISLVFSAGVIGVAVSQIGSGWIPLKKWKVDDVSTDLWGWKQLGAKFAPVAAWNESHDLVAKDSPIFTFRWFPAANFDYYVARPLKKKVYCFGELERIHKYYWINRERGNLLKGSDAWYIALSDDYEDPVALYGKDYEFIMPADTLAILRGKDTIRKAFIYRLIQRKEDLILLPGDSIIKPPRKKTALDTIVYLNSQIRSNPLWMKLLEKKATEQGILLDDLIRREVDSLMKDQRRLKAGSFDTLISVPPSSSGRQF